MNYGSEWSLDAFDRATDCRLKIAYENYGRPSHRTTAIDFACGTGEKAQHLARTGFSTLFMPVISSTALRKLKIETIPCKIWVDISAAKRQKKFRKIDIRDFVLQDIHDQKDDPVDITLINFRRCGHFLAPRNLRKSITNIAAIAEPTILVSISMDCDLFPKGLDIFNDTTSCFSNNYLFKMPGLAGYARYNTFFAYCFYAENWISKSHPDFKFTRSS